jgi:hypothetical protein
MRPVLRRFRYGGNIRLSRAPKLNNYDALEVYVDGRRLASSESGICTFHGKTSTT